MIFIDLTENLGYPAVLMHSFDFLISAWAPPLGRTDFPPGATPDEEHQELWTPYADPAAIARPTLGTEGWRGGSSSG